MLVYGYRLSWPERMGWYDLSKHTACGRRWAEWFAAISGGIYIPFELYELFQGVTWLSLGALVVNVFIVGLMVNALIRTHRAETANAASPFGQGEG